MSCRGQTSELETGFSAQLFRGSWVQLLILRILYITPMHGYRLLGEVNGLMAGRRPMKTGSLYTILRRMEKAGLLESKWDVERAQKVGSA